MIFVDEQPRFRKGELRTINDGWRSNVAGVVEKFSSAFPDIHFEAGWNVAAFNGQAWRERNAARVVLYGGLLRHKLLGIEAIALLFAHEAGHHLGGGRRDEIYTWMSCEREADIWASSRGVFTAWADDPERAVVIVAQGAKQILNFELRLRELSPPRSAFEDECLAHSGPQERYDNFMRGLSSATSLRPT